MNTVYFRVANRLFLDSHETYELKKTFFNVLRYIHDEDWIGACHASSNN